MSKINIKPLILTMACLCLFMCISCAFASDANDMNNVTGIDDADTTDALEIPVQQTGVENANGNADVGTFTELDQGIKSLEPGRTYCLDKDYTFDEAGDNSSRIITISTDNIVFDGRSHTIDASGASGVMFNVVGNNICIKNLKFANFHGQTGDVSSPIQWNGNNGTCDCCDFYNSVGVNGGAILWNGNDGSIIQGIFVNNTAIDFDGTVAISGDNVKIVKSLFYFHEGNVAVRLTEKSGKPTTLYVDGTYFECDGRTGGFDKIDYDNDCKVILNGIDLENGDYEQLRQNLENLKTGEYYNIMSDYAIVDPEGDLARNRIINIKADNVTINGNGHTIDARASENYFAIFNVTGNNVTILNLQITHSRAYDIDYLYSGKNIYGDDYNPLISPIEWHGDRGVISNCKFIDNTGVYGGAISWNANNGIIENCVFDNNAAKFGGSVYINGTNNIIRNSKFKDSYTTYHYESIYFTCHDNPYEGVPEYLIINGCTIEGTNPGGEDISADDGCVVLIDSVNPSAVLEPCDFNKLIDDLKNLKDNDVYTLNKDYYVGTEHGLIIRIDANNVTINGNGHTIFGKDPLAGVFYIHGNDIRMNDLTIAMSNEKFVSDSLINWMGDNGELTNSTLIGGHSEKGGALFWSGNNATIDGCLFNKNIAAMGGAIYASGNNTLISNCAFRNSGSTAAEEAIYYKNNGKGYLNISDCSFDSVKVWIGDASEVTIDGKAVARDFTELSCEILNLKENEVYDIYRNYEFVPSIGLALTTDNITINGNEHMIYVNAALQQSVFNVKGNGITINRLNFNNSNNNTGVSFINWIGNNGIFTECALIGNTAQNGGAINWKGNNGLIDNCVFMKNTASFGGAIYVGGIDNTISNSYFLETGSSLATEAIYVDPTRKGLTLENVFFDEASYSFLDGKDVKIDLENVYNKTYEGQIADEHINFNPLIYISVTKGGINYYNDDIYYYSKYFNETGDFIFTITKEFREYDITYSKEYHIKNINNSDFNKVYDALYTGSYENHFILSKTAYVDGENSYRNVATKVFATLDAFNPISEFFKDDQAHSVIVKPKSSEPTTYYMLDVKFTGKFTINSAACWDLRESPYNVLNIDGNGSVIRGSFEDRKEEKWFSIGESSLKTPLMFYASNLSIEGFNTAVENFGGECIFTNVNFKNNKMDYIIDRDWGAAMLNTGVVTCINCTFTGNYAKNGGAIFNQGMLTLQDCIFRGNAAYGKGPNVCIGDCGKIVMDGKQITSDNDLVYFTSSLNLGVSTLISVACVAVSFTVGLVVGFFTANPAIGIGVGILVGSALGVAGSSIIIANTYDATYNRLLSVLTLSIGSAVAGASGGALGASLGAEYFADYYGYEFAEYPWKETVPLAILLGGGLSIIEGMIYFTEYYKFD